MGIYTTRKIQADEELILRFERCFRTDEGETIDFDGFTPYWMREGLPDNFLKGLSTPSGPRPVRPPPGTVKFGKSSLHDRGAFAEADFKQGEIVDMCPCLILDEVGADCARDLSFKLPQVKVDCGKGRTIMKREELYVIPCGYGAMLNHMREGEGANVQWYYDESTQCMVFVALEDIPRNTELCFDYGEQYWMAQHRLNTRPGYMKEKVEDMRKARELVDTNKALFDAGTRRRARRG